VNILAFAIVVFAGWTLATNALVLMGASLQLLLLAGPLGCVVAVGGLLRVSHRTKALSFTDPRASEVTNSHGLPVIMPVQGLLVSALITALLGISWIAFWLCAVLYLTWITWTARRLADHTDAMAPTGKAQALTLTIVCLANAVLAFVVCRPDQDDAFYVGVAAFAAGHPTEPLLAFDPMLVERSWPLIFPSYRFASYELLVAAVARVTSIPALSVAHIVMPPIAAALSILASYALARELRLRNALTITILAAVLSIVLGETARSPANFAFDRIFQGKAILLSVVIPAIYAFTIRHARHADSGRNLYILACAYVAAVGVSNFGMLIAPAAGLTAAAAAFRMTTRQRAFQAASCAAIPLPYLLWVAFSSHGGAALANVAVEGGGEVWASTFGTRGQYLISFALLAAPVLAMHRQSRALLAIPTLLMLAIALNPVLSPFIARYITTPPVFWRMTWLTPTLIMVAASITLLFRWCTNPYCPTGPGRFVIRGSLIGVATVMAILLTQSNTLRTDNGVTWSPGQPKLVQHDASTAALATRIAPPTGRILAPDTIASIISMNEHHPTLVFARSMYVYMLRDALPRSDYEARMRLASWVNGAVPPAAAQVQEDLRALDVAVVVKPVSVAYADTLRRAGYDLRGTDVGTEVWRRRPAN
jgi:hypothetical protein